MYKIIQSIHKILRPVDKYDNVAPRLTPVYRI